MLVALLASLIVAAPIYAIATEVEGWMSYALIVAILFVVLVGFSIRARNGQQTPGAAPRSLAPAAAPTPVPPELARRMRMAGHRGASGPSADEVRRRMRMAGR